MFTLITKSTHTLLCQSQEEINNDEIIFVYVHVCVCMRKKKNEKKQRLAVVEEREREIKTLMYVLRSTMCTEKKNHTHTRTHTNEFIYKNRFSWMKKKRRKKINALQA